MELRGRELKDALGRWCVHMKACAAELNQLDARLGDGDLGATLEKCADHVALALPDMADSIPAVFKACAAACARASGSSFGTLLAVGCMTAAKKTAGQESLDRLAMCALLQDVVGELSARGGAVLGDKTVLDALDAVRRAVLAATGGTPLSRTASDAVQQALLEFRGKTNKIGRARMFGERTIGLDDPGMVAIARMVEVL